MLVGEEIGKVELVVAEGVDEESDTEGNMGDMIDDEATAVTRTDEVKAVAAAVAAEVAEVAVANDDDALGTE